MSEGFSAPDVYVEFVQRYTCYFCGAVHENVTQAWPGNGLMWLPPPLWQRIGPILACPKHTIEIKVDGQPLPVFSVQGNFPPKKEGNH